MRPTQKVWIQREGQYGGQDCPAFATSPYVRGSIWRGGASLLFAKPPSPVEVYNDLDSGLVGFFRVLRNPETFAEFHRLVSLTPYAREEWAFCRDTWAECTDEVERAYRWFVVAQQSFSGRFGHGWSSAIAKSGRGMATTTSSWLSMIEGLPRAAERLLRVQVEQQDWRVILDRYDRPETLFYCDPPYVASTRRAGGYAHEMSDDDHRDLVERLLAVEGMVMLSGYDHEIYRPLEDAGWERREFQTVCHAVGRTRATGILGEGAARRTQKRVEVVWRNPACVKGWEEAHARLI